MNLLRNEKVCVINNNFLLAPWADILYACDLQWWEWFDGVPDFAGEKWILDKEAARDEEAARRYGLNRIKSREGSGLTTDGVIYQGSNSGIQAINLIWHLYKPDQIILLGYDMQRTGGKSHYIDIKFS